MRSLALRLSCALPFVALSAFVACSGAEPPVDVDVDVADHHDHEGEADDPGREIRLGETTSALVAADPVSKAVTDTCSTSAVNGLSKQLVDEIQCLRPGTMGVITGIPNVTLGPSVSPFLQTPAVAAMKRAVTARGAALRINSGLRTLPAQYMLYRWYRTGRCGISLAASPGTSNHESGLALDIQDNAGWRASFQANGWRWLGANDPVHYDYTAGGVTLRGLSVRAFQRLWNRNNPNDVIAEDGSYGPQTEARVAQSPIGGFKIGASCTDAGAPREAGAPDGAAVEGGPTTTPDEERPASELPMTPDAPEPDESYQSEDPSVPKRELADEGGCAASPIRARGASEAFGLAAAGLALGLVGLRGRRRPRG